MSENDEIDELENERDRLHQLVCDFQAAALIVLGSSGDPSEVEPRHLEAEIIRLRDERNRLVSGCWATAKWLDDFLCRPGVKTVSCSECRGSGIFESDPSGAFHLDCPVCDGTGEIYEITRQTEMMNKVDELRWLFLPPERFGDGDSIAGRYGPEED